MTGSMIRNMMGGMAALAVVLAAQTSSFDFSALAEKAKSKVELNLDGEMLKALGDKLDKLGDVKSVRIHAYEYTKEGDYPAAALEPLLKQYTSATGWSRLVHAQEEKESADIFVQQRDGKLAGLVVIAMEPKSVAVIEATGAVELAQLQEVVKSTVQFDLAALQAAGK